MKNLPLLEQDCFVIKFTKSGKYECQPDINTGSFIYGDIEIANRYASTQNAITIMDAYKGLGCDCKIIPVTVTITERKEVRNLKTKQVNIEAVRLGDIIGGKEVVTILDRQDDKFVSLFLDGDVITINGLYGKTIPVQR